MEYVVGITALIVVILLLPALLRLALYDTIKKLQDEEKQKKNETHLEP